MRARSRQGDDESHARIFPQSDRVPDHLWNAGNIVQRANANDCALNKELWRVGDQSGLNNAADHLLRIWIQIGPSQHSFELGIILEEITGPQDSEWGIERLKRCL